MDLSTTPAINDSAGQPDVSPPPAWRQFLTRHGEAMLTAACAGATAAGWLADRSGAGAAAAVLYTLGYLAGGWLPARDALRLLWQERELDVDLLMVLAALGAAFIGHPLEGAVLIFIFSLSGTLETYAMARTRREITALMQLKPAEAMVIRDGQEMKVPAARLRVGDTVVIRPGERIPADGEIASGESAVDQAAITGESVPVDKAPGDTLFAGTINGHGALQMKVLRPAEETVLARIIRMVEEARTEKPPSQLFVERFERIYSRVVILGTVLVWAVPYFLGEPFAAAFYRAMVFMVASSPCALTMAIMPTLLSGIANAARNGVLLKGGLHLENLGVAKIVCFDKTGTLTRGEPKVTDVVPVTPGMTGEEALRLAASLETRSEHPLAAAIVRAAWDLGLEEPKDLAAMPGQGLRGQLGGQTWQVGRPALFAGDGGLPPEVSRLVDDLEAQGKTVVLLGQDQPVAAIALRDELRPGAAQAVAALKRRGLRVAMLTGDNARTAAALAAAAGVDEYWAGLLPDQKVRQVQEMTRQHGRVAMVGDGVNDAPALAVAAVGIAMGRRGTDVAMETADIVLMGDDLSKIPYVIGLGRRSSRVVRQNIAFATGMILLLIAGTFAGGLSLPLGVVGHEGSTVLVILSGLRLLAGGPHRA